MMQKVPAIEGRPETGAMQFGDDWPGVFIRGDNAGYYAMHLARVLDGHDDPLSRVITQSLLALLRGRTDKDADG